MVRRFKRRISLLDKAFSALRRWALRAARFEGGIRETFINNNGMFLEFLDGDIGNRSFSNVRPVRICDALQRGCRSDWEAVLTARQLMYVNHKLYGGLSGSRFIARLMKT